MTIVDIIAWLLVLMAALPVTAALVLRDFWGSDIRTARERARLAALLAALGLIGALLALNHLLNWKITGSVLAIPLGLILLLLDFAAGAWLRQYWLGSFDDQPNGHPETDNEREDRLVGDKRRAEEES